MVSSFLASLVTPLARRSQAAVILRPNENREFLFKILVVGDIGTGKTSFIKRYVHNFFSQAYKATVGSFGRYLVLSVCILQIGVDFALKVLNWDANTMVRMQLWDIAGGWGRYVYCYTIMITVHINV
jgi:Ras-related protein Rab-32